MSGYLIRVGLDSGDIGGGGHAPIEYDGNFDYIPIPEDAETTEKETYNSFSSRLGVDASKYTSRSGEATLHRDPEFKTYTYGEVGTQKRRSLRKLSEGDLLIFYSSLQPRSNNEPIRLYIIGYFTIDDVYDLEALTPDEREEVLKNHPNNAHVKRENLNPENNPPGRDNFPIIVSGEPDNSKLLNYAVPLTSPSISKSKSWYSKYRPLSTAYDLLGLNVTDLTRSMPKKLRGEPEKIRRWLDGDFTEEVESLAKPPKHYVQSSGKSDFTQTSRNSESNCYVIKIDSGFAPHVHKGLISLATCAPQVRSSTQPGDWVFAVGNEDYTTARELVYAFRVEYTTHMDDYFTDERFETRRPLQEHNNPAGDNIYAPRSSVSNISTVDGSDLPSESGAKEGSQYEKGTIEGELCYTHQGAEYFQLHAGYHDLTNYDTDLQKQGDREKLLISSDFYYFGENHVTVPENIAELVVPGFGNHNSRNSGRNNGLTKEVASFVEWLRTNYRIGIHGEPKHAKADVKLEDTTGPGC